MKITNLIESRRNSNQLLWKFAVSLKDNLWEDYFKFRGLTKHYFYLLTHLNKLSEINRLNNLSAQNKLIAFDLNEKFFLHNYLPVYERLKNQHEIYFIVPDKEKDDFSGYLRKFNIPQDKIISASQALYVHWRMYINCWLPNYYPNILNNKKILKIQMYHGIGTPNFRINSIASNLRDNKNLRKFDIHFMIGPQYEETLNLFKKKLFKVGYPKLDKLFNNEPLSSETKKEINFKNKRPVILYAPHHDLTLSLNKYKLDILKMLINTKMNIIVKFHNRILKNHPLSFLYGEAEKLEKEHSNFHVAEREDSTEYYPLADIIVTDVATSSGPEAAICNKPVILINSEEWFNKYGRNNIEFKLKKLFPLANSLFELNKEINKVLRKKTKIRVNEIKSFYFNPGKATKTAIKIIENYLK